MVKNPTDTKYEIYSEVFTENVLPEHWTSQLFKNSGAWVDLATIANYNGAGLKPWDQTVTSSTNGGGWYSYAFLTLDSSVVNAFTDYTIEMDIIGRAHNYGGPGLFGRATTENSSNDGKSPSKPLKTIDDVNNLSLKSGDVVYFERGGIFRGQLSANEGGVTYAAYGTGDKPQIYASPYNAAQVGRWSRTKENKKVYKYSQKITSDVGNIILNGGAKHGVMFTITNNMFILSKKDLVQSNAKVADHSPIYSGNTYIQFTDLYLGTSRDVKERVVFDSLVRSHIKSMLGDNKSTVIYVKQ